jgi:cytochrome c-type biogenesis protein CcmH/NrfG
MKLPFGKMSASLLEQAEKAFRQGDFVQVRSLLLRTPETNDDSRAVFLLGLSYIHSDPPAFGEAVTLFKDAVSRETNFAEGWFYLGFSLAAQAKVSEAVEAYLKAVQLSADDARFRVALGAAYFAANKIDAASNELVRALELGSGPSENTARMLLARVRFAQGRHDDALQQCLLILTSERLTHQPDNDLREETRQLREQISAARSESKPEAEP